MFIQLNQSLIRGDGSYSFLDTNVKAGLTYYYEVENVSLMGQSSRFTLTSIKTPVPQKFELYQNYPNPFNPSTEIKFDIPAASAVYLSIYNILGREVRVLVDNYLSAGTFTIIWDGRDDTGTPVSSGLYFYRFSADNFSERRKMILLK